jgi:hypothetical protein
MKCPICVSVGQTSKFYWDSGGYGTSMCGDSYYDEDGKYHNHDPNVEKRSCRCSRGHEFLVAVRHKCWCGHGEASTMKIKGEDGKWTEASPEQVEAVLGTSHGPREGLN